LRLVEIPLSTWPPATCSVAPANACSFAGVLSSLPLEEGRRMSPQGFGSVARINQTSTEFFDTPLNFVHFSMSFAARG
jgi:hypothetical protein